MDAKRHDPEAADLSAASSAPGVRRFDDAALAAILAALLEQHPEAMVGAIDPSPSGSFVPLPPSLDVGDRPVLQGRNALDLVVSSDRVVVIEAWEEARAGGIGRAVVRLAVDPADPAVLHLIDAQATHGVYLGLVVAAAGPRNGPERPAAAQRLQARIGRMHKSELAIILEVDEALTRILGWTEAELVGHRTLEFIHPDDQQVAIGDWLQLLGSTDPLPPVRQRLRRADGGWAWFEVTNHNCLADPERGYVIAEMIDVSHEMAAETALRAREQLLRRLTEALPIGVLQASADGGVVYTNDRLHRLLGTPLALDLAEQLSVVAAEDRPILDAAVDAALGAGIDADLEVQVRPPGDTSTRRCLVRLRALTDEAGAPTGAVLTLEDVTESARLRAALEVQATRDVLTRTLNRASVLAALDRELAVDPESTTVIFVDLDRFKAVNDQLGHSAGDDLLRIVADRLRAAVRDRDSVGRIGGDEFIVVCPGVQTRTLALQVAERIATSLLRPVTVGGTAMNLQASIGVARGGSALDADRLVAQADEAMYASKREGRGRPILAGDLPVAAVRGA